MARKDTLYDFSGLKVHFLCVLQPSASWRMFHVTLKNMCILLLLDGVFCVSVSDDWLVVMIGW